MSRLTLDVETLRADTPGVENSIHLNAAGAALMPAPVIKAVSCHLAEEAAWGGYEAAERHGDEIDGFYDAAAAMLGCDREEIAFVENATRGWDMAFYSIPLSRGDRVLTSVAEYASNYIAFLQVARRTGAKIDVVPNDDDGQLSLDALQQMLDDDVKLVAVTHVPTNGGLINPASAIGTVTQRAGIPFLLDACQSAGQIPLDVRQIGCDLLSFTGRKYLRGPRGTGALYARRELAERLEPPLLDLHAADWVRSDRYELKSGARRFENWESNVAGKVGLAVAIRYALDLGLGAIQQRVRDLAAELRGELAAIPGVLVCDRGEERCGIVTFNVNGRRPEDVRGDLRSLGISVWHSNVWSTRLDMEERGLDAVVRASVHYYNTPEEIAKLSAAVRTLT